MKKIILACMVISFLSVGTVSSKSKNLHGEFKGNPIVKVTSEGLLIKPDKNPSITYQDEVYIPVSILKKIGLNIASDSRAQSVEISKNNKIYKNAIVTVSSIYNISKKYGVSSVYVIAGETTDDIVFNVNQNIDELLENSEGLSKIIIYGNMSYTNNIRIVDPDNNEFSVPTDAVRRFLKGELLDKDLWKTYTLNGEPLVLE